MIACVCGGSDERPNDDCERCQLIARIGRLERLAATLASSIERDECDGRPLNHREMFISLAAEVAFDLGGCFSKKWMPVVREYIGGGVSHGEAAR
jgi:hypothetical protein